MEGEIAWAVETSKDGERWRFFGKGWTKPGEPLILHGAPKYVRFRRVDGEEGRCTPRERAGDEPMPLLRPDVGAVLPVFVVDEYEGFEVKRFVELTDDELRTYLDRNVAALRAALAWHGAGVVVTGHAIPGAVIGRRATGPRGYVAKVH